VLGILAEVANLLVDWWFLLLCCCSCFCQQREVSQLETIAASAAQTPELQRLGSSVADKRRAARGTWRDA